MSDIDFAIELSEFNAGFSPLAHLDDKTFVGASGQASDMKADIISKPGFLTQSPALADLTNGNQSGVVDQLIRHILDKPTADDTTFAVGTSKLFKLSPTAVISGGSPSWPQAITLQITNSHVLDLEASSSQYASLSAATKLNFIGNLTIEGRVKFETKPSTSNSMNFLQVRETATDRQPYGFFFHNDSVRGEELAFAHQNADDDFDFDDVTVPWSPSTGVWYHVAVVIQGSKVRYYVDGVQQGEEKTLAFSRNVVGTPVLFIGSNEGSGNYMDGKINNFRVWAVARTQDQILWGMNRSLTEGNGLKGSWYAVNNHNDLSSNGNDLTASGSPVFDTDVPFATFNDEMTEGESVIRLKENLFVFYNKASDGDIAAMPLSTEVIDPNWGSTTDHALEKALHPSAVKEDILVFGNGRYVGVYVQGLGTLDAHKLDFGEGSEVADVVFHANVWWIAVNFGEGKRGQIYLYDGSATSNILSDEAGVGDQKIGFLYVLNGNVFVAYDDKSSDGFSIGVLQGRTIKPLRYFKGTLPDHRQKALFKNTLLFVSSADIWSFGASVDQLPIQISKLADGGHTTVGGIASPFGTPMVASSDGGSNHRLAKFSGFSTDSNYKSVFIDITKDRMLGKVHTIVVSTKALGANAKAEITLEGNQGDKTSNTLVVTGTGKTRHIFKTLTLPAVEDVRVIVSYANGHATNDCPIRKIALLGSFIER